MASPPERRARAACTVAALSLALLAASGCGKANLSRDASAQRAVSQAGAHGHSGGSRSGTSTRGGPPAGEAGERVAVPLPLTAARASAFAHAVSLQRVDVPGSKPIARTRTPASQEREAAKCGGRGTRALGGARSAELQRGDGLDRESISSGVDVLSGAGAVRADLAYAASAGGLACYAKVLGKSLRGGRDSHVRLLGVHVGHLALGVVPGERASGIRIAARVVITGTPVAVRVYVDALSLQYGPAELDLYTTSFVQPVAQRTQSELLALLRERARQQKL